MILDQVFHGVLNESVGTLEVHDEPVEDVSVNSAIASPTLATSQTGVTTYSQPMYSTALDTLKQMGDVVKSLYEKVSHRSWRGVFR